VRQKSQESAWTIFIFQSLQRQCEGVPRAAWARHFGGKRPIAAATEKDTRGVCGSVKDQYRNKGVQQKGQTEGVQGNEQEFRHYQRKKKSKRGGLEGKNYLVRPRSRTSQDYEEDLGYLGGKLPVLKRENIDRGEEVTRILNPGSGNDLLGISKFLFLLLSVRKN